MVEQEMATYYLAAMDELTTLCNRRGFLRLATHTISLCKRQAIPASVAYIDLNSFKKINDLYGHAEGDLALKVVARQLEECFRGSDVISRVGGDEFVVLMTNTTAEKAITIMQRLSSGLVASSRLMNLKYEISFSYGLVDFDWSKTEDIDSKILQADTHMYQRKKSAKDNQR
jgi:diguanylate cyclase (GGDEF)-like protein